MLKKLLSIRFLRFLAVGGLNTLFGFVVYSLFALTTLETWLVLIISSVAGIAFSFISTGGLVFRDMGLARVPRFILCYAVIVVIYSQLITWLSPICGGRIWAMAIIILPMSLMTYFLQSWFVFRNSAQIIKNKTRNKQ